MVQAANQVKTLCEAATTPEEKCLTDVAKKRISAATRLSNEVEKITELHKKGKGNIAVAMYGGLKSWRKRNMMTDLDGNLCRYTETMQTLLITRVCNQNEAGLLKQREDFDTLDQGLKSFVLRIAEGHNKIELLLQDQGKTNQEHVTNEATRTIDSVNAHITTQAENREMRETTSAQHQRLLRSVRFNEMKERMNAITDPEDACFDRILQSFEEMARGKIESRSWPVTGHKGIDRLWHSFADWLQSDGHLFWIRGTPGSGKSTLVKYVASKKVTQTLLSQWDPSTRILSHFFWKLGISLQKNIKGFYCSLVHQLLEGRDRLTRSTLDAFPMFKSRESHHDWSVPELYSILWKILELATEKEHLCIFIDGLDEFVDDRGQEVIMKTISDFKRFTNVKICVTSRPEPWLKEELDTVPQLKLHDLTAPDMRRWIQMRLQQTKGTLSSWLLDFLVEMLLEKAGGVFLWIRFATQSIIRGIKNKDSTDMLISRLEQLPEKLEDLYYDMWKRLGDDESLYRKSAATYMRFMVGFQSIKKDQVNQYYTGFGISGPLTVITMACASQPEIRRILTAASGKIDYEELNALCEATTNQILTNCAGLLEVYPSTHSSNIPGPVLKMMDRVEFIHRTAYDFLVGTEAGQDILSYSGMSDCEMEILMFYGVLCWQRILHDAFGACRKVFTVTEGFPRLLTSKGYEGDRKKVTDLWTTIKSFHESGILARGHERWPPPPFASLTIALGPIFKLEVEHMGPNLATSVLRGIPWHEITWDERSDMPVSELQFLLSQGADPTTVVSYIVVCSISNVHHGKRTTALWEFLHHTQWAIWTNGSHSRTTKPHVVEVAADMLRNCPSIDQHGILSRHHRYYLSKDRLHFRYSLDIKSERFFVSGITFILSANVAYLLDLMLYFLPQQDEAKLKDQVQFIRSKIKDPKISLKVLAITQNDKSLKFFQVVDQRPFEGLIAMVDERQRNDEPVGDIAQWYDQVRLLTEDKTAMIVIEPEYASKGLAGEVLLGLCEVKDVGFEYSQQLHREVQYMSDSCARFQSLGHAINPSAKNRL